MQKKILLVAVLAVVAVAAFRFSSSADDKLPSLVTNAPAPVFVAKDFKGKSFDLAANLGKIIVLEWTNPDCPFVKRVYRDGLMNDLQKRWTEKGVVWKTVNSTYHTTPEQNEKFAEEHALPGAILDDRGGELGRLYGARTTPHIFIINQQGALAYQGALDSDSYGDQGLERVAYVDLALKALSSGSAVQLASAKPYGCSVKYR